MSFPVGKGLAHKTQFLRQTYVEQAILDEMPSTPLGTLSDCTDFKLRYTLGEVAEDSNGQPSSLCLCSPVNGLY